LRKHEARSEIFRGGERVLEYNPQEGVRGKRYEEGENRNSHIIYAQVISIIIIQYELQQLFQRK
jgi:hypothetical protein